MPLPRSPVARARLALAVTWALLASSGQAQVRWMCHLSDHATRLVCVAEEDPARPVAAAAVSPTVVRGTRFPLNPRGTYTVDLWSPATDRDFTAELAQATLCYRTPDCQAWLQWERRGEASPGAGRMPVALRR